MIQMLPVNDTMSTIPGRILILTQPSLLLHYTLFTSTSKQLPVKHDADIIKSFRKKQKQLNALPDMDYEQVIRFKLLAAKGIVSGTKK